MINDQIFLTYNRIVIQVIHQGEIGEMVYLRDTNYDVHVFDQDLIYLKTIFGEYNEFNHERQTHAYKLLHRAIIGLTNRINSPIQGSNDVFLRYSDVQIDMLQRLSEKLVGINY